MNDTKALDCTTVQFKGNINEMRHPIALWQNVLPVTPANPGRGVKYSTQEKEEAH